MNKKIAIIGGAGFIGHNLGIFLKNKGAEIFLIDSLSVNNFATKSFAARIGPKVCELEGPIPIEKISRVLTAMNIPIPC